MSDQIEVDESELAAETPAELDLVAAAQDHGWLAVARWCPRLGELPNDREIPFILDLSRRAPSEKHAKWLLAIYGNLQRHGREQ
jgi:hypothetical protein